MDKDSLEFGEGKGIHLIHMNVRSLGDIKKTDSLKLQIGRSKAHIIGISETWLNEAIPSSLMNVKGYNLSRVDRAWGKGNLGMKKGGGVAIYWRDSLKVSDQKYAKFNLSNKDGEVQWLSLKQDNVRPILILNVYRPPQGDCKSFCKNIQDKIQEANLKDNTEMYIMGDFNVDYLDKRSKDFTELNTSMKSLGLKQIISSPTRYGNTKNSCLDLIFTNSECIAASGVINVNISDHFPVFVSRKKERTMTKKTKFEGRSYTRYNKEEFQANLLQIDWENFYSQADPNVAWGIMKSNLEITIEEMCPLRVMKGKVYDDPWITREIIEMIKDKDRLMKNAKTTGIKEDWDLAKQARNFVSTQIRNLKSEYLKEEQENNVDDPKKFWRNISSIIPKDKGGKQQIILEKDGVQRDPGESAGILNHFFTGIGPTLANDFDPNNWEPVGEEEETKLKECATNFVEVHKLCQEIKITKSSGYSHLSSRVLKDSFMVLSAQLSYLFNLSLTTAIFPEDWKRATVVPLYKGGTASKVGNYRPVSLLPLPGKLLEKVVHSALSGHLENNGLLTDAQNGFRKNRSTVSGIANFTDEVLRAMNEGKVTVATFIDLRKAFDTVNHPVLLKKLKHLGVGGNFLKWCTSYLEGRSQKTVANGVNSDSREVTYGVPQGSVLGPLFFLTYINDMSAAVENVNLSLYADDTVLYVSGKDIGVNVQRMQGGLDGFADWCQSNALKINAEKTKVMIFGTTKRVKKIGQIRLRINNAPIHRAPSYKYLGMTLDSSMSFKPHLATVVRSVSHKIYLLSRIKKFLSNRSALLVYKTMVLPFFDYADVVYHNANTAELEKLQRLQNRALKLCLGLHRREDTEIVHRSAKVPLLENRRRSHIYNFMYKRKELKHNLDVPVIKTRSADAPRFILPNPNLQCYKRSLEYSGAKAWNNLPKELKLIPNYLSFKRHIHKKLMDTVG